MIVLIAAAMAAPVSVHHQGRLLDAVGTPIDATVTAEFRIMDAEVFGTQRHSETVSLNVEGGYYSVVLAPDASDLAHPAWLEVLVDGQALGGRSLLGAVPVAASLAPEAELDVASLSVGGTDVLAALTALQSRLDAVDTRLPHAPVIDHRFGTFPGSSAAPGAAGGDISVPAGTAVVLRGRRSVMPQFDAAGLDASSVYHLRVEEGAEGAVWALQKVPYAVRGASGSPPSDETAAYYDSNPDSMLAFTVRTGAAGSTPSLVALVNRLQLIAAASEGDTRNISVTYGPNTGTGGSAGENRTATFSRTLNWSRTPYVMAAADGENRDDYYNQGTRQDSQVVDRYGATIQFTYRAQNGGAAGLSPWMNVMLVAP